MASDQGHEQDNRSGHNIGDTRCEGCDAHYYWCHLDDAQKYFFKCMVGDFKEKMIIPEKFVKNFKGQISEVIKLEAPDGNIYDIKVAKDPNKIVLGSGWAAFVNANELTEYDLLVFKFNGGSHLKALIFEPSGCEKQLFRAPNVQERNISHDQSFPRETRRRDVASPDNDSRKTKRTTLLNSPSARSGIRSPEDNMNSGSGGLQETAEPCYVLATGCNLTKVQKAEVDALAKKIRPVIPFYITAMNKISLSESLVVCKDYATKHLPHEDKFITLRHPQKSSIWVDNLKVTSDGARRLSVGWSCFVRHNELRESDICIFEVSKSNGEVIIVVHSLEGGHHLPEKEPESQDKYNYPVEGGETEEEESYKEHAESNYCYPMFARGLSGKEQEEILGSVSIQPGNPVYVAILRKVYLSRKNNAILIIPSKFAAKHLAEASHDILLLRPNRKAEWLVKYYWGPRSSKGFSCRSLTKFFSDNKLRKGDVCVFELMKAVSKAMMMVHVFRKVDGRFVLLD